MLVKRKIKEEDIMVHHDDLFYNIASKYIKLQLTEMHGEVDILTIVVRDF